MKLPFWATIFMCLGFIVLCSLGMWQLKRLAWKQNLLSRIQAEYALDPASVNLDPSVDLSISLIKRGFLKGEFLHDKAILIQAKTYKGNIGYHLITPFKMADFGGKVVFVNRGWIPSGLGILDDYVKKTYGLVMITGVLKQHAKYNDFVPENEPDKDQWYKIKPEEIANAKGIENFYSNIFYKESRKQVRGVPNLPIAEASKVNIRNDHAGYALFWFLMAIALVIIYFLRFISPQYRKQFK